MPQAPFGATRALPPRVTSLLAVFALVGGLAAPAHAARVTDVADAADGDDPFDANLGVRMDYDFQYGLIVRENTQYPGGDTGQAPRSVRVRELEYMRHRVRLVPRIEAGLFHDLSVFVEWPFVLAEYQTWGFASGTTGGINGNLTTGNSTLIRDMALAPTVNGWPQTGPQYGIPGASRNQEHNAWRIDPTNGTGTRLRGGVDYPVLGLRWSPVNNERDDTKPTITLQADYRLAFIPFPVRQSEAEAEYEANEGPDAYSPFVADARHRFHFLFAISKRYLLLDPYFVADYNFPFQGSDSVMGFDPRHDAGFMLGMEIVPYENEEFDQKLSIDLAFRARYFSKGRDYSQVSDIFNELTYTDEFVRAGANLGVIFRAFKFLTLDITGSALYDTDRFLTTEALGCDGGCPEPGLIGYVVQQFQMGPLDGEVDPSLDGNERNPYFNPVLDTPGRRVRLEQNIRAQVMFNAMVTF